MRDRFAFVDAPQFAGDTRATGKRFLIPALSFAPSYLSTGPVNPLIVQPCIEKATARVRAALHRVAEACVELRGHYRLYGYTSGEISLSSDGPVTLEVFSEPHCVAGVPGTKAPVTATRGMVCSTFIWQGVQSANSSGGPRIIVDGQPLKPEPPSAGDDACSQRIHEWGRERRLPPSSIDPLQPIQGFYAYSETDRQGAAKALQQKLTDKVMENLSKWLDEVAGPPLIGGFLGGAAGVLISGLIGSNPLLLGLILGVSTAYVDEQVEKIRVTAKHLANQLGSSFQSDDASEDNESDEWVAHPGRGNTVSPDDIVNSWASPFEESDDAVVGIYGSNIVAEVLSPRPIEGDFKPTTWEIWTDRASAHVRVFYRDAGVQTFVGNAIVHIGGCPEGELRTQWLANMTLPQSTSAMRNGQYYAQAVWTDPKSNYQWRGPRKIVQVPGPVIDLEVFPPKQTRRKLRISGEAQLLNRHASDELPWPLGTDPWEATRPVDSADVLMSLDFSAIKPGDDPEFWAWLQENYGSDVVGLEQRTWPWREKIEDWGFVYGEFNLRLSPSAEVVLTVRGGTRDGTDETDNTAPDWGEPTTIVIPPKKDPADPPVTFKFTIERTGPAYAPVRATLALRIDNDQQTG